MDQNQNKLEEPNDSADGEAHASRSSGRKWILIILIILAAAGWYVWQHWQVQQQQRLAQDVNSQQQAMQQLRQQSDVLAKVQADLQQQRAALAAQVTGSQAGNRNIAKQLQSLGQRITQLEAAVSGLSMQQLSGADRMRLDDVEMLLQQAGQRYRLFHDSSAALSAMQGAERTLDSLDDVGFAGVRQTLDNEIRALVASHPQTRTSALNTLRILRDNWPRLPSKPLDRQVQTEATGNWSRIWHALSSLVRIRRETGDGTRLAADIRLARQVAAIDLAQAQAALLGGDSKSAVAALDRTGAALSADFDSSSPLVQQAQAQIRQLQTELSDQQPALELGSALQALRDQRQVRRVVPQQPITAPPADQPAPAASVPVPAVPVSSETATGHAA